MDLVARWQSIHELPDPQRDSFIALPKVVSGIDRSV